MKETMKTIKLNKFQEFTMSYWLKARVAEIGTRDLINMLNDTRWLAELLETPECALKGSL